MFEKFDGRAEMLLDLKDTSRVGAQQYRAGCVFLGFRPENEWINVRGLSKLGRVGNRATRRG